jgi:hypothetical protein
MKKQEASLQDGANSNHSQYGRASGSPLSKEQQWIELIYGNSIALNVNWAKRVEEATRMTGVSLSDEQFNRLSREYFLHNRKLETYWSMVIMKHNICNSLRELEQGENVNENNSYKTKLENAMKIAALEQDIERREQELFKNNDAVKDDIIREIGKQKSKYEGASLHDQLITGKRTEIWTE